MVLPQRDPLEGGAKVTACSQCGRVHRTYKIQRCAEMARARRAVRAHALAWAFGGKRLDPHGFNLRYFPHLGTYSCRSLYTTARVVEGVRWPA